MDGTVTTAGSRRHTASPDKIVRLSLPFRRRRSVSSRPSSYAALVDVGLPDGGGLELARRIAALPWSPRVLITSSDVDAVTDDAARSLGAVGFLPKAELVNGSLRRLLTGVP